MKTSLPAITKKIQKQNKNARICKLNIAFRAFFHFISDLFQIPIKLKIPF